MCSWCKVNISISFLGINSGNHGPNAQRWSYWNVSCSIVYYNIKSDITLSIGGWKFIQGILCSPLKRWCRYRFIDVEKSLCFVGWEKHYKHYIKPDPIFSMNAFLWICVNYMHRKKSGKLYLKMLAIDCLWMSRLWIIVNFIFESVW